MIEKLELIPDRIFKDPSGSRNKAIINLFAKNFPELLDYYGKSCLDYFERKETATNISSSFQCQQFFKTAKENNLWLSDAIKSKYSGLKK
jgi:hypothetical protein